MLFSYPVEFYLLTMPKKQQADSPAKSMDASSSTAKGKKGKGKKGKCDKATKSSEWEAERRRQKEKGGAKR